VRVGCQVSGVSCQTSDAENVFPVEALPASCPSDN
jgi:hypothetical protein